jgi:hypothetical protein
MLAWCCAVGLITLPVAAKLHGAAAGRHSGGAGETVSEKVELMVAGGRVSATPAAGRGTGGGRGYRQVGQGPSPDKAGADTATTF